MHAENVADEVLVEVRQRNERVDAHAAELARLDRDVRPLRVETDADVVELLGEQAALDVGARGVKHHEDEVAGAGDGDNLATAALAARGAFDDAGQIEQLQCRVVVLQHTGDARQRGEGVRGGAGLRVRERGQHGGLTDGGKTDHGDAGIAGADNLCVGEQERKRR